MAEKREILGHIDCPACGTVAGMRITHDKNGEPFGYCEAECSQQLRIGGDARRVRKFMERYPHLGGAAPVSDTKTLPLPHVEAAPVSVTPPEAAPEPKAAELPERKGTGNALLDLMQGTGR